MDQILLSGDVGSAVEGLDSVKGHGFRQRDLQMVAQFWTDRSSALKQYLTQGDRDLVTVSIADVLVQAAANGAWKLEPEERETIRSVLQQVAATKSWPASVRALSAIAFIDDAETARFLVERANQSSDQFRPAVVALSLMCAPAANEWLGRLEQKVRQADDKTFLLSTKEKYQKLKSDSSLCERRARLRLDQPAKG
ncbi:MAG: hypothetical protein ABI580_09680 [Burkholderiaceae bacterium]